VIPNSDGQAIFVEAPARLHFGILDLHGGLGRWFGGLGAAAPAPTLLLSAAPAEKLEVLGEDADRAAEFARRFLNHYGIPPTARLHVHRALPSHAGLGSGTQLALSVARGLAELFNIQADVSELATIMGRACRSAVGTWTFAGGGLVVEGGRSRERNSCGPLLARLAFPSNWQCIVVVPDAVPGLNGVDEAEAFAALPKPPERDVQRVAHLVLMALLPALAETDLATFGKALSEIQEITGRWFASVQGGAFARGPSEELVRRLAEWGAVGVGQSSWGPAVYGFVDGEDVGLRLAERIRTASGEDFAGRVYWGSFRTTGARVWRASARFPSGPVSV
jgi:beta-ribofuranosylaminobenzene 5'-phosphate synthase